MLEVGSAIQHGKTPRYGTIKELCLAKGEQLANVEWVSYVCSGYNDVILFKLCHRVW